MSRTNHHQRNYKKWNLVGERVRVSNGWNRDDDGNRVPRGVIYTEDWPHGMEVWDLRFFAGCRRRPQLIHRVLDFHGRYPARFHYGTGGTARSYADMREAEFRTFGRHYENECRLVYNAGGDVDEITEPDLRPRSIEYDLW